MNERDWGFDKHLITMPFPGMSFFSIPTSVVLILAYISYHIHGENDGKIYYFKDIIRFSLDKVCKDHLFGHDVPLLWRQLLKDKHGFFFSYVMMFINLISFSIRFTDQILTGFFTYGFYSGMLITGIISDFFMCVYCIVILTARIICIIFKVIIGAGIYQTIAFVAVCISVTVMYHVHALHRSENCESFLTENDRHVNWIVNATSYALFFHLPFGKKLNEEIADLLRQFTRKENDTFFNVLPFVHKNQTVDFHCAAGRAMLGCPMEPGSNSTTISFICHSLLKYPPNKESRQGWYGLFTSTAYGEPNSTVYGEPNSTVYGKPNSTVCGEANSTMYEFFRSEVYKEAKNIPIYIQYGSVAFGVVKHFLP